MLASKNNSKKNILSLSCSEEYMKVHKGISYEISNKFKDTLLILNNPY